MQHLVKDIERYNEEQFQMLSMGKVWVFGMSPYFASVLSRRARDLYSCIMGHFEFYPNSSTQPLFVSYY